MKKYLILVLTILLIGPSFAEDTANIRINISGSTNNNHYFLCLPNIGCLSIKAGQQGKVFPFYHPIEMQSIYVTNIETLRVNGMGLPTSCSGTVQPGHTITFAGNIAHGPNQSIYINNLRCHFS